MASRCCGRSAPGSIDGPLPAQKRARLSPPPSPASASIEPQHDHDLIAARMVHPGPHGLQLVVQLDLDLALGLNQIEAQQVVDREQQRERSSPEALAPERLHRCHLRMHSQDDALSAFSAAQQLQSKLLKKRIRTIPASLLAAAGATDAAGADPVQDGVVAPAPQLIGEFACSEPAAAGGVPYKRRKSVTAAGAASSAPGQFADEFESLSACSDSMNLFIEQLQDVDNWDDSYQNVLSALSNIMGYIQTLVGPGHARELDAEHRELQQEIHHEVAQIELLIHDYASVGAAADHDQAQSYESAMS